MLKRILLVSVFVFFSAELYAQKESKKCKLGYKWSDTFASCIKVKIPVDIVTIKQWCPSAYLSDDQREAIKDLIFKENKTETQKLWRKEIIRRLQDLLVETVMDPDSTIDQAVKLQTAIQDLKTNYNLTRLIILYNVASFDQRPALMECMKMVKQVE